MIYLKQGNIPLSLAWDDEIVQEANGLYQLSFKFPVSDLNWQGIRPDTLILADDLDGEQEFIVFEVEKMDGHIKVYANQIMTLLNTYAINSISVDRVSGQTVFNQLVGALLRNPPFSFHSNIEDKHTFNLSYTSAMDALLKGKHSIVGQWGGDLVRQKRNISLLKNGGAEKQALFMYQKNLAKYSDKQSTLNIINRLHLRREVERDDGTKTVLTATVDAPVMSADIHEKYIQVEDQGVTTQEALVKYGQDYFRTSLCHLPEDSLEIGVLGAPDEAVKLYDVVSVFYPPYGRDLRLKISKYTYSPMSRKLKTIGFGKTNQSLAGAMAAIASEKAAQEVDYHDQKIQAQIESMDKAYDAKVDKLREEVEDGIEVAKAKAEEKAAEIADVLRPEIAAAKTEVANDLAKAKTDLTALGNSALAKASTAQQAVDDAKQQLGQLSADLQEVTTYLITENSELSRRVYLAQGYIDENRASLTQQAAEILAQARAQTELVRRTEMVEQTLDGQRTTITELGKGLDNATGQIQSVGNRTKTVEDGLSSLRSSYNQLTNVVNPLTDKVQSVEQRTADLQSGVNGIREDFSRLSETVGRFESKTAQYDRDANGIRERLTSVEQNSVKNLSGNMLVKSAEGWRQGQVDITLGDKLEAGKTYTVAIKADRASYTPHFWTATKYSDYTSVPLKYDQVLGAYTATFTAPRVNEAGDSVIATIDGTARTEYVTLVQGKLPLVPWAPHWSEIKAQLAEYTAEYKRTAQGMTERLTALEVYKNGEGQRATDYFERAKEENAKQRSELWKAVQDGYVANATYTEDVRGIRRQYSEIKTEVGIAQNTANSAKDAASAADRKAVTVTQNLADYKTDVDQQLTRLTQNQRTADGLIASLDTTVRNIPGQITTAVSAVEGKIPRKHSSINLVTNSKINESSNLYGFGTRTVQLIAGKTYWIAARAKKTGGTSDKKARVYIYTPNWSQEYFLEFNSTNYEVKSLKFTAGHSELYRISSYWFPRGGDRTGTADVDWYMVVESDTAPTTWSPASEDLTSMQTTVMQTADGVRQLSTKVSTAEGNIATVQADIRRLNDVISNRLSETAIDDIKQQIRSVESLYEQTTKSFTQRLTDVTAKLPKGFSGNMLVNSGKGWSNLTQTEYVLAEPIVKGQTYTIAARYWRQSGVTEPGGITFWLVADHTTERINQAVTMTYSREVDAWISTFVAEGNAPAGKVVILTMTRGSASWATLAKGNLAISPWSPSAKDVTNQIDAKASEIRQEISKIDLSVQGVRGDMLHKNAVTVQDDGIVLKAGRTKGDVAKAIASYFKLTPEAVAIITPLIKVSGDMIVNGAITAAKLDVGSVATAILTAEAITSKHIKADRALVEKIISAEGYFDTLFSKSAFITKLQAVDLTATQIKGGVMRAINNAMAVNLNQGNIEFYTSSAALRRVLTGYPTQFVKFETGQHDGKPVGVTVIGSNRGGNENSNDGNFVGARFWNGNGADIIDLVGDEIRLVNNAYSDTTGWVLDTLSGRLALEPIKGSDRPSSKLAAGDLWLYKNNTEYISVKNEIKAIWDTFGSKTDQSYANQLMTLSNRHRDDIGTIKGVINMLIDNVNALHRYKATETGYSYSMPNKI